MLLNCKIEKKYQDLKLSYKFSIRCILLSALTCSIKSKSNVILVFFYLHPLNI